MHIFILRSLYLYIKIYLYISTSCDNRKLETVIFGVMEGKNKSGRRHRERSDDIEDWGDVTYCRICTISRKIATRRPVSPKVFWTIVHTFVCTRIDYCNSLLIGLPKTRLAPVQSVLNAAARMIAR